MKYIEIQKLSSNFRKIASRLLTSDYLDALDNLKRFIKFIDENDVISDFIKRNSSVIFDIEQIFNNRKYNERYPVQISMSDEVSFTYQLLTYAASHSHDYRNLSSGYSYSSKFQDQCDCFNKIVVHPFVQHISTFLDEILVDLRETQQKVNPGIMINENKGLISVNNDGTTNISNTTINNTDLDKVISLIDSVLSKVQNDNTLNVNNEEMVELLNETKSELTSEKPKEKFIVMLIEKMNQIKDIIYLGTFIYEPIKNLLIEIEKFIKIK